jgi:hypothetical protein
MSDNCPDCFPDGADVAIRAVESLDQVLRQMAGVELAKPRARWGGMGGARYRSGDQTVTNSDAAV